MGAVDEVAEEGSAEVTAGVETSQDKVWMVTADVLSKVLRLEVGRFLDNIRTLRMFVGSEFLTALSAWSQRIILVNTIHRFQLFDEGFP